MRVVLSLLVALFLLATGNTYLWTGGPVSQVKAYDESGSNVRTVDFAYGAAGELLSRTGSAESVSLTYDGLYHTKTLKDGNNSQTSYDYDALGRLSKISYPGASGTYYDQIQFTSYDDAGNVLTRVDGNGDTTTYTYGDSDGLLSAVSYTGASGQNVSITYDAFDRPVATTDGTGSSSTSYDDLDLVSSSSRTYTGLSAKTFDYLYYPDGSRQQMDTPAGSVTWEYDENGRFNYMTAFHDNKVNLTYLDNGWAATRELSCGADTAYGYNAAGKLTSLANTVGFSTNVSSYGSFAYDGVFNLAGLTATVPGHTAYGGATSWTYDSKDRMTQESSARLSGYTDNFAYDSSGNPTTFKGATRTFNSNNQRTSGSSYVYDGNGNPTTYAGSTLTYDRENRLTGIGSSWAAKYRADGLRAYKDVGGTKTYFLYDQGEPVIEMNSSGTVTAFNAFGPDGLVGRKVGSAWTYYTFDPQGNVAERWDENGNVLDHSAYDAYGAESCTATPGDPWGYNARWGYYADRETGLYLCQHRYYDPAAGRWITRDPIGYAGGVNVYGYCRSSPTTRADSSGLWEINTGYKVSGYVPGVGGEFAGQVVVDLESGDMFTCFTHFFGNAIVGAEGGVGWDVSIDSGKPEEGSSWSLEVGMKGTVGPGLEMTANFPIDLPASVGFTRGKPTEYGFSISAGAEAGAAARIGFRERICHKACNISDFNPVPLLQRAMDGLQHFGKIVVPDDPEKWSHFPGRP